ncbi:class I SAM-dependent methyltransferase [Marinobacter halotolerans]|uniref:class I SAM-dependent methyltransferase n=1 Tax=Marinobacter halotolerans TaxID=1569211 RepID=UPI001247CA52|nr:methyltransferase domain-containing protein [Marinobacter halotolerans]
MSKPWLFLRRFVNCPLAVGSVLPSSRYLVRSMVAGIDWPRVETVAELGAGTGVITDAIDHSRHPDSRFLSFECDDNMRHALADRYPSVNFCQDAFRLRTELRERQLQGLDCVVSGLPLFNFPDRERRLLLTDIHELLNPGGVFVAFQYTRVLKPFLVSMYDEMETYFVWANLPPAFVYLCKKPM